MSFWFCNFRDLIERNNRPLIAEPVFLFKYTLKGVLRQHSITRDKRFAGVKMNVPRAVKPIVIQHNKSPLEKYLPALIVPSCIALYFPWCDSVLYSLNSMFVMKTNSIVDTNNIHYHIDLCLQPKLFS